MVTMKRRITYKICNLPVSLLIHFKNRVYCGTFGRGLWLSDDSGDSWRPIGDSYRYFDFPKEDGILHSSITSITISPNEQVNGYGVVYVGTEPSALFRSENGGETWTELKI